MPRRSSGGRSARAPARAPPPAPVNRAPPPAPVQSSGGGSMLSGIGSTIAQGYKFGSANGTGASDPRSNPTTISGCDVNWRAVIVWNTAPKDRGVVVRGWSTGDHVGLSLSLSF